MSQTPPSSSDTARPHTPLLEPSSSTGEDLGDSARDEATEAPLHQNIPAGIGLMILGIFLFVANDVMGKWLVATYTVGQVLLIRSAAGLVMLSRSLWKAGLNTILFPPSPKLNLLRIFLTTCEVACFYWAVSYIPLADIVTLYMAAPIFVTALAYPLLGEKIDTPRVIAIIIGFIGVIIAMRPSSASFSLPALVALSGCLFFSLMMIITRHLRGTKGIVLVTWQSMAALLLGAVISPIGWVTPTPRDFVLLLMLGVVATLAHIAVNKALKLAPAAIIMPYQYTQIIWAVIFGIIIFGDWPDQMMIMGSALIIAAGLLIFWREQKVGRKEKDA